MCISGQAVSAEEENLDVDLLPFRVLHKESPELYAVTTDDGSGDMGTTEPEENAAANIKLSVAAISITVMVLTHNMH